MSARSRMMVSRNASRHLLQIEVGLEMITLDPALVDRRRSPMLSSPSSDVSRERPQAKREAPRDLSVAGLRACDLELGSVPGYWLGCQASASMVSHGIFSIARRHLSITP